MENFKSCDAVLHIFGHFFVQITAFQRIFRNLGDGNYPGVSRASCLLFDYRCLGLVGYRCWLRTGYFFVSFNMQAQIFLDAKAFLIYCEFIIY